MRIWLFCPGNDEHKLRKALNSEADVVIIDWEDSVSLGKKHDARTCASQVLAEVPTEARVVVRINPVDSAHFDDDALHLATLSGLSGVMIPKIRHPSEVLQVSEFGYPIIPLIETAAGIERAYAIASADERIERLAFGSLDLCAEVGCAWTLDNPLIQHARARIVLAGTAAGRLGAIDGVYPHLDDAAGLVRDVTNARDLGFFGKSVIHPNQIQRARDVFRPSEQDVARARKIVAASRAAERDESKAAIRVQGELVDPPVVRWAEHILEEVGST